MMKRTYFKAYRLLLSLGNKLILFNTHYWSPCIELMHDWYSPNLSVRYEWCAVFSMGMKGCNDIKKVMAILIWTKWTKMFIQKHLGEYNNNYLNQSILMYNRNKILSHLEPNVCDSTPVQSLKILRVSCYLAEIRECWVSWRKSRGYIVVHQQLIEPIPPQI